MNNIILEVTKNIINRSRKHRTIYLERMAAAKTESVNRKPLGCSNLAHAIAPMSAEEKETLIL